MGPKKTPQTKKGGRSKSPVSENPPETKIQRQRSERSQDTDPEDTQTSRPKPLKSSLLPDVKTSQSRKKSRIDSPETSDNRKSTSKLLKEKGALSSKHNIQTDESEDKNKSAIEDKSPGTIDAVDDMETRLSRRKMSLQIDTPSQSTPRSRRTSAARTKSAINQEPQDTTQSAVAGFTDTPKHLYGLDNTNKRSSGEENVIIDSPDSSPQKRIRKFFLNRVDGRCSCWYFSMAVLVMFIAIAVISALVKPYMDLPTVQVNHGQDKGQDNADLKIKSLREMQERFGHVSAQASACLKEMKEMKRIHNESIGSQKPLNSSYIDELIKAAIEVYNADKLGIPDYALESAGGQIHGSHHSPTYNTGASRKVLGFSLWYDGVPPRVILQPDNTPGTCWAFEGQEGYIVIRLSQAIVPDMFTLEHIPASLSTEKDGKISNAPKHFSVWGWMDSDGKDKVCIGKYSYDNQGALQTFKAKEHSNQDYKYIELRVSSNHGHPTHTCIYRFRVHGQPPAPTATPPTSCSDP